MSSTLINAYLSADTAANIPAAPDITQPGAAPYVAAVYLATDTNAVSVFNPATNSWVAIAAAGSGVTSLTGTTNQVDVSASTGSITLSLPQDIDTAADVAFGSATLKTSGLPLQSTQNTTTLASPTTDTVGYFVGADGQAARLTIDCYGGSGGPQLVSRRANGTAAAPTAVVSGDGLFEYRAWGHNGSTFAHHSVLQTLATENWGASANGYRVRFIVGVNGSAGGSIALDLNAGGNVKAGPNAGTTLAKSSLESSGSFGASTVESSAATLTLGAAYAYIYTGSSATTWTLPALSDSTNRVYFLKNDGSGTITLNAAGSDAVFTTTAHTSVSIAPGEWMTLSAGATYWSAAFPSISPIGSANGILQADGSGNVSAITVGSGLAFSEGTLSATGGGGGGITNSEGAYASRGSGTTAGDQYLCTDCPATLRWNGSSWDVWYQQFKTSVYDDTGASWVNQGTATLASYGPYQSLVVPNGGSGRVIRAKPYPAGAFKHTWAVRLDSLNQAYLQGGVAIHDATSGFVVVFYVSARGGNWLLFVQEYFSPTGGGATGFASYNLPLVGGPIWLQLESDTTTMTFRYSLDGSLFRDFTSFTIATYLTPTAMGFSAENSDTSPAQLVLLSSTF